MGEKISHSIISSVTDKLGHPEVSPPLWLISLNYTSQRAWVAGRTEGGEKDGGGGLWKSDEAKKNPIGGISWKTEKETWKIQKRQNGLDRGVRQTWMYREGIVCIRVCMYEEKEGRMKPVSQAVRFSEGEGAAAAVAALLWLSTKICLSLSLPLKISVLSHCTRHSIRPLLHPSAESLSRHWIYRVSVVLKRSIWLRLFVFSRADSTRIKQHRENLNGYKLLIAFALDISPLAESTLFRNRLSGALSFMLLYAPTSRQFRWTFCTFYLTMIYVIA